MKYDEMTTPTRAARKDRDTMTEQSTTTAAPDIRQWPESVTAPYWTYDANKATIPPMKAPTAYSKYLDDQIARLAFAINTRREDVQWRRRELENQRAALVAARTALAMIEPDPPAPVRYTVVEESGGIMRGFEYLDTADEVSARIEAFIIDYGNNEAGEATLYITDQTGDEMTVHNYWECTADHENPLTCPTCETCEEPRFADPARQAIEQTLSDALDAAEQPYRDVIDQCSTLRAAGAETFDQQRPRLNAAHHTSQDAEVVARMHYRAAVKAYESTRPTT